MDIYQILNTQVEHILDYVDKLSYPRWLNGLRLHLRRLDRSQLYIWQMVKLHTYIIYKSSEDDLIWENLAVIYPRKNMLGMGDLSSSLSRTINLGAKERLQPICSYRLYWPTFEEVNRPLALKRWLFIHPVAMSTEWTHTRIHNNNI